MYIFSFHDLFVPLVLILESSSDIVVAMQNEIRKLMLCTGWSNWILLRNLKYYECCLRDVILKIVRDLSDRI